VLVVASVLGCMTAGTASAQEWLKDRAATEGPGVRAGDFEFHPGIGLQGGYDSNYFLRTSGSGFSNSGVQATPEMLVTPSLSLSTLGNQRKEGEVTADSPSVTFRATASGTYREFFGQLTPEQRNGSVDAAASLGILPGRPWGAALNVAYDRVIQPSPSGDPDLSFTRDVLTGSGEIVMTPGSGTLDWHLGGSVAGTLFEDTGGLGYNNLSFGAYTRGRWKFRPKTALTYDATFGFSSYTNAGGTDTTITPLHSSDPVRTHLGINGLVTPRLQILALVGYGGTFFSAGSETTTKFPAGSSCAATPCQYDSVIGNAELKYYLTSPPDEKSPGLSLTQSSIAFGYSRDFQTSYLSDYNGFDRGYVKFSYFFGGRALITAEGGGAAIEYPALALASGTHTGFTDGRVDATLFGEYRFTNSFGLNVTGKYTTNLSNAVLNITSPGGPAEQYSMQWAHIEAYLGVRLFL
jgi:hypothetical protein